MGTPRSLSKCHSSLTRISKGAYGVPKTKGLLIARGGLPINAGGTIFGGIGVSGAPSGEIDEKCAQAGIDAISDDLEMSAE